MIVGPGPRDPRKVAAIIAAVQAFLNDEATAQQRRRLPTLSAWKTASWRMVRGREPAPRPSWKHAGQR